MLLAGKIPYASTFAVFAAGRAYDQIRNSICYPNLNVKICSTHAGITVGEDGATHQMLEDISMMRTLPNMTVMSVSDDTQTKWAVEEISKIKGPVYLRLSRMETPIIYSETQKFEIGKAVQIGEGTEASIIATGDVVCEAIKAKEELEKQGIKVRVIDMHTIKPIDKEMIVKCAKETKKIITLEDHSIIGGLGSAVCEVLSEEYPCKVTRMGINDQFGKSGKAEELLKYFKLTSEDIIEKVLEEISMDEHERYLADLREKYILDQNALEVTGFERAKTEIAKKLKDKNVDVEIIIKATNLTKEEIEKL